jgi:hypothetical protein
VDDAPGEDEVAAAAVWEAAIGGLGVFEMDALIRNRGSWYVRLCRAVVRGAEAAECAVSL